MKKNNLLFILFISVLCISFLASPVWAGSKQRHRWEGVAIGMGAAILGGALLNGLSCAPAPRYRPPQPRYRPPQPRYHSPGHWETRKIWIHPEMKRIWHEGYYNRHGYWVPGHWERRHRPGFWRERRVWIPGGYYSSIH